MNKLYVDTFIKDQAPQLGQSKPILVHASDGEVYYLKNDKVRMNNGNWYDENCAFFNEVLAYKVAKFLNINTPEAAIIELESDIMSANSDMLFSRRFSPGLYYATKKIRDVEDNLEENFLGLLRLGKPYIRTSWNRFFKNIVNSEDIPAIICMDLLLGNLDRFDNIGNLMVGQSKLGRTVFAIDHGHCFHGPFYNQKKIDFLNSNIFSNSDEKFQYIDDRIIKIAQVSQSQKRHFNSAGEIFKAIETYVNLENTTDHSFMDPVALIESLSITKLNEFIGDIPNDWCIGGQAQRKAYIDHILRQSELLRETIQRFVDYQAFSNYRGGVLSWKKENLTGTQ